MTQQQTYPPQLYTNETADSKYFYYVLGADGVDNTFDIYCKKSQNAIASLHFWDHYLETRYDTLLFMAALDRFVERGGHIFEQLNESLDMRFDRDIPTSNDPS